MNHLKNEQSPYLLQHADNPVDWFPWGEQAFKLARQSNKPIFLSIGYSTCHWCHVMEHESFEDDSVANLLNADFISIKVDREELPEIDHLYMSVCQAMTGSGGWPLTIIMTPEKEPFFAGTYFPKEGRFGRPGMLELLPAIAESWNSRQDDIHKSIDRIKTHLINSVPQTLGAELPESIHRQTFDNFKNKFDTHWGGFGKAPKFPSPHNLIYLLRYFHFSGDSTALDMVETTLTAIRHGGIFDQIGFGFHRYSTDKKWLVPHFEKMLYNQAMLALAYLEAFQATGKDTFAQTAREIFTYVLRDMTAPEGGFYSAEDADTEGEEGKFYLWTEAELKSVLGTEDGEKFGRIFNVQPQGNFKHETGTDQYNTNILHLTPDSGWDGETTEFIESARNKLFDHREQRIHPFKDDKILTDWNGLMIAALAKGAVVLNEPQYAQAAQKAWLFISANLMLKNGRLLKRYRDGVAGQEAHLDDYAFLIWGLLELYETGFDPQILEQALKLADIMQAEFYDTASGGFYLGSSQAEKLLIRSKTAYDGAIPSGNSVAALAMEKLGRYTGNSRWFEMAERTILVFSNEIKRYPAGFTHLLSAHLFELDNPKEIVIVSGQDDNTKHLLNAIHTAYIPGKIIIIKKPDWELILSEIAPWTKTQAALAGKTTVYVCRNFACNQPVTDIQTAIGLINE
ncbi:MAG: thioredoxin domain-containing protein [Candidatus Marinimicrobia bacterium]|nr:thioredoxin domain-containing protein [Candidatus Neomarinimicrobiota bacterium]